MKVLLGTDGYPAARRAEDVLAKVADASRIEVDVLSVPILGLPGPFDLAGPELRREAAAEIAKAVAGRLGARGLATATVEGEGRPGRAICEVADAGKHALVVLGAGGTSWLDNLLLGSVSTYVLHHAPCSVLIVHRAAAEGDRVEIVLGTDGSAGARAAERILIGLVDAPRSDVVAVAVAPSAEALAPGPVGASSNDQGEAAMSETLLDSARRVAEESVARLEAAGLATSTVVKAGSATALLLAESHERKSDLVVVGARGIGGERLPFLGSVSDQIARHAPAALIAR